MLGSELSVRKCGETAEQGFLPKGMQLRLHSAASVPLVIRGTPTADSDHQILIIRLLITNKDHAESYSCLGKGKLPPLVQCRRAHLLICYTSPPPQQDVELAQEYKKCLRRDFSGAVILFLVSSSAGKLTGAQNVQRHLLTMGCSEPWEARKEDKQCLLWEMGGISTNSSQPALKPSSYHIPVLLCHSFLEYPGWLRIPKEDQPAEGTQQALPTGPAGTYATSSGEARLWFPVPEMSVAHLISQPLHAEGKEEVGMSHFYILPWKECHRAANLCLLQTDLSRVGGSCLSLSARPRIALAHRN